MRVKGVAIDIKDTGRFNLLTRDGRLQRVTPQEYRDELIRQLTQSVPTLADFRAKWLDPIQRATLMKQLRDQQLLPEVVQEAAHMEAYDEFKQQGAGTYVCAGCGAELFSSKEKFDSHCGWPSFYDPANAKNVKTRDDYTLGTVRTEVTCAQCNGHLGHVFKGEGFKTPTDTRYCINGVTLKFVPAKPSP